MGKLWSFIDKNINDLNQNVFKRMVCVFLGMTLFASVSIIPLLLKEMILGEWSLEGFFEPTLYLFAIAVGLGAAYLTLIFTFYKYLKRRKQIFVAWLMVLLTTVVPIFAPVFWVLSKSN